MQDDDVLSFSAVSLLNVLHHQIRTYIYTHIHLHTLTYTHKGVMTQGTQCDLSSLTATLMRVTGQAKPLRLCYKLSLVVKRV